MNDHEAQRIAAAMHELRPDWPTSSLLTLIRKHLMQKPRRDVTVALAWVACESGTATPARVVESGPWWRAAGVESTTSAEKWEDAQRCTVCSRTEAGCASLPRVGGDDHVFVSRAHNAAATIRPATALAAIVGDLRDHTSTTDREASE